MNDKTHDNLTPKAIVRALDEHIIGQQDAKRAVAVALRNRWRRQHLSADLRDEVSPKNILMIGPTGCGKTEISRRLAKLADAPFVKVEATKFTEVGYVGRDVEQIGRDLAEEAIRLEKARRREAVRDAASKAAMDRLLKALVGDGASEATRESFRQRLNEGAMNEVEVEIEVEDTPSSTSMEIPGMGGGIGMINLSDMLGKAMGGKPLKRRKMRVADAWDRWWMKNPKSGWIRTMWPAWLWPMPRPTASSSSTRSTRSPCRMCAAARFRVRACSATCCR
jgi:ATP-dependent HslUV protease ATP-binding subunit HslU